MRGKKVKEYSFELNISSYRGAGDKKGTDSDSDNPVKNTEK
ncbi:hypothetical protein [Bathymodiolus japonicus methanotrophic gill symbiont]|nr:hypothetical protein [Bathymodiolus japonicus methanotrophic gill symbiont]